MYNTHIVIAPLLYTLVLSSSFAPPKEMSEIIESSKVPLLIRQDLADELRLTSTQQETFKAAFDEMKPPGGGGGDMSSIPSFMRGRMKSMIRGKVRGAEDACVKSLDASQKARFDQIWVQWLGPETLFRNEYSKSFNLTKEQWNVIKSVERPKTSDEGPDLRPFEARYAKASTKTIFGVLTDTQRESLAKPFAFDPKNHAFIDLPIQ